MYSQLQPAAGSSPAGSAAAAAAGAITCTPSTQPLAVVEHGVVCSFPDDFFGYYAWPTICRLGDGSLVAVASGMRNDHVCPFGRNIICRSTTEGTSWTSPQVVNDSPLDDRDTGAVCLGGNKLLITWFTADRRSDSGARLEAVLEGTLFKKSEDATDPGLTAAQKAHTRNAWEAGIARFTDDLVSQYMGAWVAVSHDGGISFGAPIRCPASSPHGPILLRGKGQGLLYLGKAKVEGVADFAKGEAGVIAARSLDHGTSWETIGHVSNHISLENNADCEWSMIVMIFSCMISFWYTLTTNWHRPRTTLHRAALRAAARADQGRLRLLDATNALRRVSLSVFALRVSLHDAWLFEAWHCWLVLNTPRRRASVVA